jgi:hypothetical protein
MKKVAFILTAIIAFPIMTLGEEKGVNTWNAQTWDASQDFGPWVKRGRLVYQTVNLNCGQVGYYVYQRRSGAWVLVSGSLDGINDLLLTEIESGSAGRFIDEQMARLLLATMVQPHSKLIDDELLTQFTVAGDERSLAVLGRYKSTIKKVVTGNNWTLEFNVGTERGAIEHWRAVGNLVPFGIRLLSSEIVEQNGAYVPQLETGAAPSR